MNKEQLVFALETRKEEKNANQETNQNKTNQNIKKEAEIRIWSDVLKLSLIHISEPTRRS